MVASAGAASPMGDTGVVAYRLFRRDHRGALHTSILHLHPRDQRREATLALRLPATACATEWKR